MNNGCATHRSTHITSAPDEIQPLMNSQTMQHMQYTSRLTNQPITINDNSCTDFRIQQSIPVTAHIIVDFQSTNNSKGNTNYNNGHCNNFDKSSEYNENNDVNGCEMNATYAPAANDK